MFGRLVGAIRTSVQVRGGLRRALAHQWEELRGRGLRARLDRVLDRVRGVGATQSAARQAAAFQALIRRSDQEDQAARDDLLSVRGPLISVVMPVWNTPSHLLRAAIDSVRSQVYGNWQLCLCDDGSDRAETLSVLQAAVVDDVRIRLVRRVVTGQICAATNAALELAEGDYVAFLDHDDLLHPYALAWVADELSRHPDASLVYTDEDKIDESGRRFDPHLKPDFNYELLLSVNYLCHLCVYRREVIKRVGGLREGFEGAQDHDLALRVLEHCGPAGFRHIDRILYHWRVHEDSTAGGAEAKPYAWSAGQRAVQAHLDRGESSAVVERAPEARNLYRPRFLPAGSDASVEVVIPTRDRLELLSGCVESILGKTSYPNYRICIVDNGSIEARTLAALEHWRSDPRIRVLRIDAPFNFSMLNNRAVESSTAQFVVLMNNDIEILTVEWIEEMLSHAARPGVGCVGARLWYPNDRLQHGGVILGIGGIAGHSHKYLPRLAPGYHGRAVLLQSLSAVTGACLMVRRDTYCSVGGLDEALAVAFNDIDFCLRVGRSGLRCVWTPFAEMLHRESASRGLENNPEKLARFKTETALMRERWGALLDDDPAYSKHLTREREDFTLAP